MEFEGNSLALVHHEQGFIKNLLAPQLLSGTANGNTEALNITSTQNISEGLYEAEQFIDLLPDFEGLPYDKFTAQIKPIASNYQWQYSLNDHLGNIRVIFTDKNGDGLIQQSADESLNEVLSVRNYSSFGLELGGSHQNINVQNKYKFGGKELNDFTQYSDFGGRWLDKTAGRWTSQDILSELSIENSNYIAMGNDPIGMIYPDGNFAFGADGLTNEQWMGAGGDSNKMDQFKKQNYQAERNSTQRIEITQNPGSMEDIPRNLYQKAKDWWNSSLSDEASVAASDLARLNIHNTASPKIKTNGGALMTAIAAFGSAMQQANGFRYRSNNKKTLFHYTNESGYKSIMNTKVIKPSFGNKNARHGSGQYFTNIKPGELTAGQTSRKLFGVPWNTTKISHYIEVDINGMSIQKNGEFNYLAPGTINLPIGTKIVSHGKTKF